VRDWIRYAFAAFALTCASNCFAQSAPQPYPVRTIRWIVPFTPGAGADTVARLLAEKLGAKLGQPVIIENRGGAGGLIGTETGARSAPDGYTWILGNDGPFTVGPYRPTLPYDTQKDFAAVSLITKLQVALVVNPAVPARNVQELVSLAKKPGNKLTVATAGNGSLAHLAAEYLSKRTGAELFLVPYKGVQEALTDLIAGRADVYFPAVNSAIPYAKGGQIRVLAVASKERVAELPDVPTFAESGYPTYEMEGWHALFMPAGTPQNIVNTISADVAEALKDPELTRRLLALGLTPVGSTPEQLDAFIAAEAVKWKEIFAAKNTQ
jgi:tripartite-type tricarboxylate transporter receptor subunit TctC